jgi:hypothetical protein
MADTGLMARVAIRWLVCRSHCAVSSGLVHIIDLRKEIADYRHVFELVATEAVDRRFRMVIEQFQPKQRRAIKIGRRTASMRIS